LPLRLGRTYETLLVVSGLYRGRVVYVDAEHAPPYFTADVDFLDWYDRWPDELLAGAASMWFGRGPRRSLASR
jgi:hypothetical protein